MDRTDAPGNQSGEFVEADASIDLDATEISADFLDNVQESIVRTVEAAGLTPTDGTDADPSGYDQLRDAVLILAGRANAQDFTNLFINGSFGLWQRALTNPPSFALTTFAQCTADRWFSSAGGGTATVTRLDLGTGLGSQPRSTADALQWAQTVAGAPTIEQRLELLERLDGQPITVAFDLRTPSAPISVTPYVRQNFGAGGSAEVTVTATPFAVGTGRTRFSATFTVPSIVGKTRGSGWYTAVGLALPNGVTFTIEISAAQAQFGSAATTFCCPDSSVELTRAQRYFFTTYEPGTPIFTATHVGALVSGDDGASVEGLQRLFPVPMRTAPTMLFISAMTGAFNKVERPPGADAPVTAVAGGSSKSTGVPSTGGVLSGVAWAHVVADAEL